MPTFSNPHQHSQWPDGEAGTDCCLSGHPRRTGSPDAMHAACMQGDLRKLDIASDKPPEWSVTFNGVALCQALAPASGSWNAGETVGTGQRKGVPPTRPRHPRTPVGARCDARPLMHSEAPCKQPFVHSSGFTLIEVMIVVAVIGILSVIALPHYSEYIRRSHRSDARAGLLQAQLWMERGATAMGTYPEALPASLTWADDHSRRYVISLAEGNDFSSFLLLATPRGAQAHDKCGTYTLTQRGERGMKDAASGLLPQDCWSK